MTEMIRRNAMDDPPDDDLDTLTKEELIDLVIALRDWVFALIEDDFEEDRHRTAAEKLLRQ